MLYHKGYIITCISILPVGNVKACPVLSEDVIELQFSSPNETANNNIGNKYNMIN